MKKRLSTWLLRHYKQHKQRRNDNTLDHALKTIHAALGKARYGFLITQAAASWSNARYVEPIHLGGDKTFQLWVGTHPNSRKVKEIRQNPKITFAFGSEKEGSNLILQGTASIETDLEIRKKYWKPVWRLFFPNGPKGDDYVVVRIRPERIELMNFRRNITPEPFGLRPLVLKRENNRWEIESE